MDRLAKIIAVFCFVAAASLEGRVVGESATGFSLNPAGLVNETVLVSRFSFADTNRFLLSDAHLDLGALVSITPVGGFVMGRAKVSPLLFLDLGVMVGAHFTWKYHTFASGTTDYSPAVLDTLEGRTALIPCIVPFWVVKLRFGPISLYNSFYLEKFFRSTLWYYWYPELMVKDGWVFSWNSYALLEISSSLSFLLAAHLQTSHDTGDTRFHAGPGLRYVIRRDLAVVGSAEFHLKKVNYSGLKISFGLEFTFFGE